MATGSEQQDTTTGQQETLTGALTRKRMRVATPLHNAETTALQAALREIQQLREERMQQRAEYEAQIQQRDEVLRRMEERIHLLDNTNNQLSRSNYSDNDRNDRTAIRAADFEGVDARVSINKELGYKLKPDIFDGTVPLREFFSQFELIARANQWSDATKNVALISCLRGKARAILECVNDLESLNYAELKSKLELRFGEGYLSQSYYSQFTNRKQKSGEDEATLGSDIERLSQLAYPECPHHIRDKIACAQFVTALSDRFVRRTLQLEGITSLKMAVQRAMAVKVIQESNFERRKEYGDSKNNRNNNKERKFNNFNGNNSSNDYKKEVKKNDKNYGKKFVNNNNNDKKKFVKECWQCGGTGHFRAECPSLKEKPEGN